MKEIKFLAVCLAGALMGCGLSACSSDDDDVNGGGADGNGTVANVKPETVFTAGLPSKVNIAEIKTNAQGLVTKIESETALVTFSYEGVDFKGKKFDATMEVKGLVPDFNDDYNFYLQLNEQGFITYALEEEISDGEKEYDEWTMRYNSDGQLNYLKRSEGNEETTITYTNGDITKVTNVELDDPADGPEESVISYGSAPVANKGCIMLFDEVFGIDMDELESAYYAGMLGKATKHLPVEIKDPNATANQMMYGYKWTLNANELPVKLTVSLLKPDGSPLIEDYDTYTFAW